MSNAKRPSLAKAHTNRTEKARQDALNSGLRVTIEGAVYEARLGDVTSAIARELRRETGMGFLQLIDAIRTGADVDVLSAFVWVSRRIAGEIIPLDMVEVSYAAILADGFDVDVAGEEQVEVDSPEA